MSKLVGLSRNLKMQWLNKVVEFVSSGLTEQEIKDGLNEYLSFEIESPTNLRKTREILMNIWVYDNEQSKRIKDIALKLITAYPEYALAIHWCMMLVTYPVFSDMCKLIGKMSEFQDELSTKQVKQKLFDEWGERSTLFHSIDKLISTLKAFDIITCEKPGKYQINTHAVNNPKIVLLMTQTMMLVDGSGYYTFADINSSTYFFAFEYKVEKETLLFDSRFTTAHFGGEMTVALKD